MNSSLSPAARSENAAGPAAESPGLGLHRVPLALVALAAAGLRLAAARGDLVLDEIWSWLIASKAESAGQIFVTYVDNNHILNTLVLYALGPRAPLWAYRLPAIVAGILALGFAVCLTKRQGPRAAFNVLVLLSFSHLLILFGTEARGYGYLVCCTLGAWWALERYFDRPWLRYACAFGVFSSLGFLSHPTFLFAWLAFGIYSVLTLSLRRGRWQRLVVLNALPVLTCVGLLFAYFEGMSIGGGYPIPAFDTLLATFSLMAGGPERGAAAYFVAAIMAALIMAAVATEFRFDRARGALFLTAIAVAPGIVLACIGHDFLYPRYFLVPMIFGYVAVGSALARWSGTGRIGPCLATALLIGYAAWNLAPVVKLLREGRGQYSTAMRWMAEHTDAPAVTVASDHDFRNWLLVTFYDNRQTLAESERGKGFIYVSQAQYTQQGTEWFLRHSFSGDSPPEKSFVDEFGNKYGLVQVFPAGSISGWTWWLYQRSR